VATVTIGGLTASTSKTKTKDGAVAVDPTVTPAVEGTLSTRTSDTEGVISCTDTDVTSSDKAVLTWVDASGNLKHRYNVTCVVAEVSGSGSGTEYEVTISSGSGDDLPAEDYTVNIGLQVQVNATFDPDDAEVFAVSMNVRGVVALLDGTDTEKRVYDMPAGEMYYYNRDSGEDEPFTGTAVTKILAGSGTTGTTSFLPKILALYDSTDPLGSGQ